MNNWNKVLQHRLHDWGIRLPPQGFGKMIVVDLAGRIALCPDGIRIVVQPEPENKASCGLKDYSTNQKFRRKLENGKINVHDDD